MGKGVHEKREDKNIRIQTGKQTDKSLGNKNKKTRKAMTVS